MQYCIIHNYPIGDTVSVSETPVGCNILIENKDKIVFEKGYFTSDLKAEAVKWVKELGNINFLPKKDKVDWFLNEDDKTSIRIFIKHFFNLTEEDLQ